VPVADVGTIVGSRPENARHGTALRSWQVLTRAGCQPSGPSRRGPVCCSKSGPCGAHRQRSPEPMGGRASYASALVLRLARASPTMLGWLCHTALLDRARLGRWRRRLKNDGPAERVAMAQRELLTLALASMVGRAVGGRSKSRAPFGRGAPDGESPTLSCGLKGGAGRRSGVVAARARYRGAGCLVGGALRVVRVSGPPGRVWSLGRGSQLALRVTCRPEGGAIRSAERSHVVASRRGNSVGVSVWVSGNDRGFGAVRLASHAARGSRTLPAWREQTVRLGLAQPSVASSDHAAETAAASARYEVDAAGRHTMSRSEEELCHVVGERRSLVRGSRFHVKHRGLC
jgi:hypothetical protein